MRMKLLPDNNNNLIIRILTSRIAFHVYFWGAIFCFFILTVSSKEGPPPTFWQRALNGLIAIGTALIPVYFHFYIFEKFLYRKKYLVYGVLLAATLVGGSFLSRSLFVLVMNKQVGVVSFFFNTIMWLLITTAVKVLKDSINQRFQLQEVSAKQVQTELELLKAQINPHFLFNTLNNLFGMARQRHEATANGIAGLSHLMRYMIYESNVDRISLEKEIEQIKRLAALQKLRFSEEDDIRIDFTVTGDPARAEIPPMLFIPFVENAFKHGISLQAPSFIKINLAVLEDSLRFSVVNSVHPDRREKEESDARVGLKNVKRRLELLFPDSYELTVQSSDKEFKIDLELRKI